MTSLPALAQKNPIRTGVIKQFCYTKYSYSKRLQDICRERQANAVEEFQELYGQAVFASPERATLKECLKSNHKGDNGYDWVATVRCARESDSELFSESSD